MCRRRAPRLLLLLPLLAGAGRLHAQQTPADVELLPARPETSQVSYTGYQVLRVQVTNNATADLLRSYEGRPG